MVKGYNFAGPLTAVVAGVGVALGGLALVQANAAPVVPLACESGRAYEDGSCVPVDDGHDDARWVKCVLHDASGSDASVRACDDLYGDHWDMRQFAGA